tara:strand:+ start:640 stop:771 length:132 start_codon:yes stop_codon:yes gene_type:complete
MITREKIWYTFTSSLLLIGIFAALFMGYAIADLINEIILMMKG